MSHYRLTPSHFVVFVLGICLAQHCSLRAQVTQLEAVRENVDFFETNVRPILEEKCVKCHSAATGKTNGGLSLSSQGGWALGGDSGPAIEPGKPEHSLVFQAVLYDHEELKMPPPDAGGKLSVREIEAIRHWIETGAIDPRDGVVSPIQINREKAQQWWAFQPLETPLVPRGTEVDSLETPIDAFIFAEQLKRGVEINPTVDKRTWLRRATYDLTGLPPTLSELEAFENDLSDDAYKRVIDRLLESPAYGEQWGRHWLDVARYADTAGDGADYPVREAYLYRNWVINAISRDLPIDQFIRMQIAGDILAQKEEILQSPDEYAEHVIATGFLAVGKRYGYAPNSDYQHLDFADALDSVGRSLLGLSIGCARCHDHKYDPISMEDYYSWYGILQSTQWAFPGGEEHKRPAHFPALVPPEQKRLAESQHQEKIEKYEAEIRALTKARNGLLPGFRAGGIDLDFEQQKMGQAPSGAWLSAGPNEIVESSQSPFKTVHPKGKQGVRVGTGKPNDGVRYVFESPVYAREANQIFFHIEFRTLSDSKAGESPQVGAYRFYLGRGVIASTALDISITSSELAVMQNGQWKVVRALAPDRWYSATVQIDIPSKIFQIRFEDPDGMDPSEAELIKDLHLNPQWDGVIDTFICDGLGHVAGLAPARDLDNIGLSVAPFELLQPSMEASYNRDVEQNRLAEIEGLLKERQREIEQLKGMAAFPVAYGVAEGKPVNVSIQKRGEPDKLGDIVARRNLEILGGEAVNEAMGGSGRLQLAQWLTSPKNPLTARVFVNRVWQWHFGQGLVRSPSDFGLRGEEPTHPQLLDWLTSEFIRSGWSLKNLHRLIMSSRVYGLSSNDNTKMHELDPNNIWLWKFQRRPLSAEELRDSMMFVAGTLNSKQPAAHPFPTVDSWAFTIHNPFHAVYESDHRSVYLMKQRNRRHPYLTLFDGADPNQSQASRSYSTTPTQSLYLMNSPFVAVQADALATNVMRLAETDDRRIEKLLELTTGYRPTEVDVQQGRDFLKRYSQMLQEKNSSSESKIDPKAWAAYARVLITGNSFLFVD